MSLHARARAGLSSVNPDTNGPIGFDRFAPVKITVSDDEIWVKMDPFGPYNPLYNPLYNPPLVMTKSGLNGPNGPYSPYTPV